MRRWVVLLLLLVAPVALGKRGDFEVDRYALRAPASAERNLDQLGAYLKKAGQSSEDRARAVYRWITEHIAYDAPSLFAGAYPDQSAEAVLKRRTAVCAGYANLYQALASRCNLEVAVIGGSIRRDPEDPSAQDRGHAWNAVRIGGRWRLLDSTWGSGSVDYKTRRFERKFNPYYFLVPPEQLIFSHIPDDKSWQLLARPKSVREIEALPRVTSAYFRYGVQAAEQRGDLVADGGFKLKFRTAPGVRLSASVYREGGREEENLTLVQPEPNGWTVDALFPTRGSYKLVIWGNDDPFSETFDYVLDYRVEARRSSAQRFPTFSGDFLSRRARVEYPRSFALKAGKKTAFSLQVPDATDVQVITGSEWQPLQRQGPWFRGQLALPPGPVKVSARFAGSDQYWLMLGYRAD